MRRVGRNPENAPKRAPPQKGLPARVWATFRPDPFPRPAILGPKALQDSQQRPQERPRTANIGSKTANIGPKSGPRAPT